MVWSQVNDPGVWADGVNRFILSFYVDADNYTFLRKRNLANTLEWYYRAGGVNKIRTVGGVDTLDFFHMSITVSANMDEVRAYLNGVQQGAPLNGLGVWAGLLKTDGALIGSWTPPPNVLWHGWEAHAVVFDYAMPLAGIEDLAVV